MSSSSSLKYYSDFLQNHNRLTTQQSLAMFSDFVWYDSQIFVCSPKTFQIVALWLGKLSAFFSRNQTVRLTDIDVMLARVNPLMSGGTSRHRAEQMLTLWRPLLPYGYSYKAIAVPDRIKLSFVNFDTRALWRSALSVRVPGCQKLQMTA